MKNLNSAGERNEGLSLNDILLDVSHLTTSFQIEGKYYAAVDNVSLTLKKNEVLAIVGESGCGKSALAFSLMGLHNRAKITGDIQYKDNNISALSGKQLNKIRGKDMGMIFQDALSALNPLMTAGNQIAETILLHHDEMSQAERKAKVVELLNQVGIPWPEHTYNQYPHELSGGMRQRIVIAMAIANNPEILIADEPTTAVDATIQSQILDLIKQLKQKMEAGIILITHDLGVVAEMADRVAVMYAGELVEITDVFSLFDNPLHPYTRSLLKSMPSAVQDRTELHSIYGSVPSLKNLPRTGCRFSTRIPWLDESKHEKKPEMHEVNPGHFVRCSCYRHFYFPEEHKEVL